MNPHRRSRCLCAIVVGLGAGSLPTFAADGPFLPLSLEQACAKAEKEHKVVFVDFFTTWCVPCRMLDETTWKNKEVIAWLTEKTVPLKLDAEKEEQAADRYNVESYPTLIFLKPDGTEIDRVIGMQTPEEFLEAANGVLAGKDAVARAREQMEAAGGSDPMTRMQYARALERKGLKEEALKEYLWCFDEGPKHRRSFYGVRLSFLLSDIADLGETYPPALVALRERRDAARREILSGKAPFVRIAEFTSINGYLGTPQESLALYDQLRAEKPKSEIVAWLREDLTDELLKQRRYAEIAEGVDIKREIDREFEQYEPSWFDKLLMLRHSKEQREQINETESRRLVRSMCEYYQILIGLKRFEEADALAQRLLKVNGSAQVYNALAWNGYLTGAPVEANEAQARKAHEMTQGKNAAVVDTLARVLNARGKRKEAVAVVREALKGVNSPNEREALNRCLADLEGEETHPSRTYGLVAILVVVLGLVVIGRRRRGRNRPNPDGTTETSTAS